MILCVSALFGVTIWATSSAQQQALEASVTTDLAGLVDIFATGGEAELKARIGDRLAMTGTDARRSHYMLADSHGNRLGGDIADWPELSARLSESGFIQLKHGPSVFARATSLGPDVNLLVAREYGEERTLIQRLTVVFVIAGAAILLLVGAAARLAAVRLARRVERINRAYRAPMDGESAIPLVTDESGDEIDELASHSGRALNRLADLAREQRHMTDNVAHEIRTPLMHLDSSLMSIGEDCDDPEAHAKLDRARQEIREITELLDSLLDIASNQARRGDPSGLVPVDLSDLCQRLVELYESSMEEAGITLHARIAPHVELMAEEMQLSRIVTNLLDNAIKYVPAGGSVWLTLEAGPRLTVRDDGPGIAGEARAQIFSRFTRGRSSLQKSGHGLGLSLARAIAERHGMTLNLADSDTGAMFVMERA